MNTLSRNAYLTVRKLDHTTPVVCRPVLMVTRRCLRTGQQEQFDRVLHWFLGFAVSFPGHLDAHVLTWFHGDVTHFAVAHRFNDAVARQKFTSSPDYRDWLVWLRKFTDEERTNDTMRSDEPRRASPPSSRLALAGVVLAFILFGLAGILPAAIYLELST